MKERKRWFQLAVKPTKTKGNTPNDSNNVDYVLSSRERKNVAYATTINSCLYKQTISFLINGFNHYRRDYTD